MTAAAVWDVFDSPLGPLTLQAGPHGALARVSFAAGADALDPAHRSAEALATVAAQLAQYFAGRRRAFDVMLDLGGTPFQRCVWDELVRIPLGETVTYTELARRVGRPGSVRAVGAAVGRTPVPIVVPCHRVVGADGSLTGYVGGLERKRALLDMEAGAARME